MSGMADPLELGLPFELFTHVTRFCGQKVVLLGLYNGQRLASEPAEDIVTYARTLGGQQGRSFARVLLLRGRLQVWHLACSFHHPPCQSEANHSLFIARSGQ